MHLQMLSGHSKRKQHKDVETAMVSTSGTEVNRTERCEEMINDPCVAVKPERAAGGEGSRDETATELYANSADNCESGYGPANAMRKALTIVFSKVKRDQVGESYGAEVEGCEENKSTIKSSLKTLECDSDATEGMSKINNSLETLECDSDAKEEMSKINNSLETLECDSDAKEEMSKINNSLETLECDSDARKGMSKIDISLETLECDSDARKGMSKIDISLETLECDSDARKGMSKINNSLETLECDSDARKGMSKINNSLETLECDSDARKGMSKINNSLETLECDSDARKGMSKINNSLETLECDSDARKGMSKINNSLETLEYGSNARKGMSKINNSLETLECDSDARKGMSKINNSLETLECDSDARKGMSKINNSLETLEYGSNARKGMSKINNSLETLECDSDAREGMSKINNSLETLECDSNARKGMSKVNNSLETLESDSDTREEMISESDDSLEDESEGEKNLSTKKRIHRMTEMISSMFNPPCVGKERFDGHESFLDLKMERLTEQNTRSSCLFDEDAMQKKYEDESVLYSTDMSGDIKMTIKAYYGMAGGFIDPLEQVKHEEKKAYDITSQEWKSLVSIFSKDISVKESVETGKEYRYCEVWSTQELTDSQCSLVELQEETVFAEMEKKANCCRGWDCSKIVIGGGAVVLGLFAVYACVRSVVRINEGILTKM